MSGFNPVEFVWAGSKYVIPAHKVLSAIARVEEVITLHELQRYGNKGSPPLARIAMAYGTVLRFAGCPVTDVQIYEAMFGAGDAKPEDVIESIVTLIAMMVPPAAAKQANQKAAPTGNASPTAVKNSRKRRTN